MTEREDNNVRRRMLLAAIGAHGILGHNSANQMPIRFSARRLLEILPEFSEHTELLTQDLAILVDGGLLRKYNTGRSGYANTWEDGPDVWYITPDGLTALWMTCLSS